MDELISSIEHLKVLGWKETRPWHEFFASFKPVEMNPHYIQQRVTTNILHYRSNYLFIAIVILLLRLIFSPLLLISLGICGGLWYYAFVVHDRPFVFGEFVVEGRMKATACGLITFIFLALTGSLESIVWSLLITIIIVGLHALFRPRSISSRANYVYEDAKYSWLEGNAAGGKIVDDIYQGTADPENPSASSSDIGTGLYGQGDVRKRGTGGASKTPHAATVSTTGTSKYD